MTALLSAICWGIDEIFAKPSAFSGERVLENAMVILLAGHGKLCKNNSRKMNLRKIELQPEPVWPSSVQSPVILS